jgi:hypothetical protein
LTGLFFYAILLYSCYLKGRSLWFKISLSLSAAAAAFIYSGEAPDFSTSTLSHIVIEDYKYYTDSLHYIVTSDDRTYEMYDEAGSAALRIGDICTGNLPVSLPAEQRNFIKNDGQQTLRINELSGRIYLNDADGFKMRIRQSDFLAKIFFNPLQVYVKSAGFFFTRL